MKYIEIKPGIKVLKSAIEFTEDLPEGGCRVATLNSTWDCGFSSDMIWQLISLEDLEESLIKKQEVKQPFASMWGTQHWAG